MRTFDIDGVICMGNWVGVRPSPGDIIITGRSFEEANETDDFLRSHNITNRVYYNPVKFESKTRESSGEHKARIIKKLIEDGLQIRCHFEDDEVQAKIIERKTGLPVVLLKHNLVNQENVKRDASGNEI